MSDGFDDLDDVLLGDLDLDAQSYLQTQPSRPAPPAAAPTKSVFTHVSKKPRLDPPPRSSPPPIEIALNKDGTYGFEAREDAIQEDEIVDQRRAIPLATPARVPPPRRPPSPPLITSHLEQELQEARRKITEWESRYDNANAQAIDATAKKQSAAGEIENLRRTLKAAQKQNDDLKRAHKEDLETARAELEEERKLRKVDSDRLATESVFREQETVSARTRRRPVNGTQRILPRTPVPVLSPSPKKPPFKTFQNSFAANDLTPARNALATPKSRSKGKQKIDTSSSHLDDDSIDWSAVDLNGDLDGDETAQPIQDDVAEPYNWTRHLLRLLFSHRVLLPASDHGHLELVPALPLLLQAQLPADTPIPQLRHYNNLCTDLVSLIGQVVDSDDIDLSGFTIASSTSAHLVGVVDCLLHLNQTSLLVAALSLMAALAAGVPTFSSVTLSTPPLDPDKTLPATLASVCQAYVLDADASAAATKTLTLLESMVWDPSDADLDGLESLLREPGLFSRITDPRAPIHCNVRALRLVNQLAGHKSLFRAVLGIPIVDDTKAVEGRLPFVERLATLLARDDPDEVHLKDHVRLHLAVLDLVLLLALSHDDATVLLTKSASLLARLVVRLYRDVALIHEGDGSHFDTQPSALTAIIVRAVTALRVLYVLACGSSAALDLCHGLDEQAAVVVGARGMFAVGVGRLAFADPPEWLPKDEARALESVSDAAQAILEKELTPEELEAMYELWQEEADGEATQDDEDEAAMVVDDV